MAEPRDIPQPSNQEQVARHEVPSSGEYSIDPMATSLTPYASSTSICSSFRSDFSMASRTNRDIIIVQNQQIRGRQETILGLLGHLEMFMRPRSADPPRTFPKYVKEDDATCLSAELDSASVSEMFAAQNRFLMTTQEDILTVLRTLARYHSGPRDDVQAPATPSETFANESVSESNENDLIFPFAP
jgi:hypothetical protein